jgi:subtilisin family serine protease
VPTVHLDRSAGRSVLRWAQRHPRGKVTLRPTGPSATPAGVAPSSSGGDPNGSVLKPDLVAPGTGLLAGTVPDTSGSRWALASGTSAATAWTSGAAAVLLARHRWSAPVVRSALATSAGQVGGVLRSGAGALRLTQALRTTLAYTVDPGDYRSWLSGDLREVNTPSLLVPGAGATTRRLTNIGARSGTWQVSVVGFERHDVQVSPTSVTLRPGRSARFRVRVGGGSLVGGLDEGALVWTGADGVEVRIPVAISR